MQEAEKSDWSLVFTEEDDGLKSWQVRDEVPKGVNVEDYSRSIIIEWRYADEGPPDSKTRQHLNTFGALLDELDNTTGNSINVHVIKGGGVCEWCYYAKDYTVFMQELNKTLAGHPRFPIAILHDEDPTWKYWNGIKEIIRDDG